MFSDYLQNTLIFVRLQDHRKKEWLLALYECHRRQLLLQVLMACMRSGSTQKLAGYFILGEPLFLQTLLLIYPVTDSDRYKHSGMGSKLPCSLSCCERNRILRWQDAKVRGFSYHWRAADDGTRRETTVWWQWGGCDLGTRHQKTLLQEVPVWTVSCRVQVTFGCFRHFWLIDWLIDWFSQIALLIPNFYFSAQFAWGAPRSLKCWDRRGNDHL